MRIIRIILSIILVLFCLTGCSGNVSTSSSTSASGEILQTDYKQISQDEARAMMAKNDGHIIVDVRRQDEYDEGHIPGAILIPNESIDKTRPEQLPDLDQIILVYCRSGRRSKEASAKLSAMGYKNVYEFGGIITWTGETTRNDH
ncbi:MAG: rhodanese-like domain-containing protein [Saccharofermentans sp.]|nr:rhodanese-like domain-containing protein [Saccharofermentans sp.]